MQLKEYQLKAVDKLLSISKKLLDKEGTRVCVIKAPTGSGKTILIAHWLSLLSKETLSKKHAFIWISGNNLHKQSKDKLQKYLKDSRYTLSYLEGITGGELLENDIVFVNWHSLTKQDKTTGKYTNVFMRDNESDKNLQNYVINARGRGLGIVLIVDESHYHYWTDRSQDLVKTIINPSLILEVSATPTIVPSDEDIEYGEAGKITIRFDDVVAEGMIKKEVIINPDIGENIDFTSVADEVILNSAIKKRELLKQLYEKNKLKINPLLLIQLPSEGEKTSTLDENKMEQVVKLLKDKHDITVNNGKLAIWLSEDKQNLPNVEVIDNTVDVLIFKQAIALGWDCPRAQILVIFREIKSKVFEVQTVGRILRMPEAKHYQIPELDRAYVYTNIDKIAIKEDKDSRGLFQVYPSHRVSDYVKLQLPSIYLKRVDYGDLTLKFRRLLKEEASKYFGITEKDSPEVSIKKADIKLDLSPNELGQPIISDAIFTNIDSQTKSEITGNNIIFSVSEDEIKHKFESFAKLASLPYAPIRSCNKIQLAIYEWFDTNLGYKKNSRLDIQRIVVCSETNQRIFQEIIEAAKVRFKEERREEINSVERIKQYSWDVPEVEYYNENNTQLETPNYVYDNFYLRNDRSQPEKDFEKLLCHCVDIKWWYKNGTDKDTCFAIEYIDPRSKIVRAFYPDYIVYFNDGAVGIYDTKSGLTAEAPETEAKSNALHCFIKAHSKDHKLKGGIVQSTTAGMYVFEEKNYQSNTSNDGWKRLEF